MKKRSEINNSPEDKSKTVAVKPPFIKLSLNETNLTQTHVQQQPETTLHFNDIYIAELGGSAAVVCCWSLKLLLE